MKEINYLQLLEESYAREERHLKRIDKLVDDMAELTIKYNALEARYKAIKKLHLADNSELGLLKQEGAKLAERISMRLERYA